MAGDPTLSHTAAIILHTIGAGHGYGLRVMEKTGLPSGTVYPAMRRLERDGLIKSQWEAQSVADAGQRPARKYYRLTRAGKAAVIATLKRYPLLVGLTLAAEIKE